MVTSALLSTVPPCDYRFPSSSFFYPTMLFVL